MMSHVSFKVRVMTKRRTPTNRLTLGIDEAGRGPAIGPMVMAAVAIDSKAAAALSRKGLRDSKSFGAGGLAWAAFQGENVRSSFARNLGAGELDAIKERAEVRDGAPPTEP